MNIGAEILAAKNGYILDSANVNIQSGNAKAEIHIKSALDSYQR
jgi:hypothetical protein